MADQRHIGPFLGAAHGKAGSEKGLAGLQFT